MICTRNNHRQVIKVICCDSTCPENTKLACQQCINEFHSNHLEKCYELNDYLNYQKYSLKKRKLEIQQVQNQIKDLQKQTQQSQDISYLKPSFDHLLSYKEYLQLDIDEAQLSGMISKIESQLSQRKSKINQNLSLIVSRFSQVDDKVIQKSLIIAGHNNFSQIYKNKDSQNFRQSKIQSVSKIMDDSTVFQNSKISLQKNRDIKLDLFSQGLVFYKNKEYKNAIGKFEEAIKMEEKFEKAWIHKIIAQTELKKHQDALNSCEDALQRCPDSSDLHFIYGLILEELNLYSKALQQYKLSTQSNPLNADCWAHQGQVHYHLRKIEESIPCLLQALSINENHIPSRLIYGQILMEQNNYQEAIQYFQGLNNNDALYFRAICLKQLGQIKQAMELADNYCRLETKDPRGQILLGELLLIQNQISLAETVFERVINEYPELEEQINQYVIKVLQQQQQRQQI